MKAFRSVVLALLFVPLTSHAAQLLVLNKGDATLAFIEPLSGKIEATVSTGDGPHEIELSSDGKIAYVSNYGGQTDGNTLSIIDVKARKELRRVDLGDLKRPHGLAVAGDRVYFTAERSRKVGALNTSSHSIDWSFATDQDGTHMVFMAPSSGTLFTTNIRSNTVSIIERADRDQPTQTLIAVGDGPEGLDLSPDGRELWVAHSRDGGISVIDTATKKVSYAFNASTKRSNRLKFAPDGRLVLVSDLGSGELVAIDARTRTERSRVSLGRAPTGILIPKGGQQAYVAVSGENRIAVIDLKTLRVSRAIETGNSPDGMAWVP
jgi:YVTN family beta-propeller protein